MPIPFKQVDVFTDRPFSGNPVAVVLDAVGMNTEEMQRIANWTNLSETTFVLPPTQSKADYRVRIFTPTRELPFAGHPTLGTAHAVLESGLATAKDGQLVQESDIGLVPLSVTGSGTHVRLVLSMPDGVVRELTNAQADELEVILGSPIMRLAATPIIDVGPQWIIAQLEDADAVLKLRPDLARMASLTRLLGSSGVTVFGPYSTDNEAAIEVRSFAPAHGLNEDPVCGSGNGCVAMHIRNSGQIDLVGSRYVSSQGACRGRNGRVYVEFGSDGSIQLGGQCITCVDGIIQT